MTTRVKEPETPTRIPYHELAAEVDIALHQLTDARLAWIKADYGDEEWKTLNAGHERLNRALDALRVRARDADHYREDLLAIRTTARIYGVHDAVTRHINHALRREPSCD